MAKGRLIRGRKGGEDSKGGISPEDEPTGLIRNS